MIINTNLGALNAHRLMKSNNAQSQKAMEKLSSGKKINSAADNAAGLSISEKMKAQIRGLEQATLNTQQGIDLIKTSDGAMGEIHSILQRMRELSVQATNDTNTDKDRKSIQTEITQLSKQIDSVSKTTEFNTIKTIDGSLRNIPPNSAVEVGKPVVSPISIHDDTSATIASNYSVNFSSGIEIHGGKQAVTELQLNSPINIASPNNELDITYVDENNITHTSYLFLDNISVPSATIGDLANSIQNAINDDTGILSGKISVAYSTSPDKITLTSISSEPNSHVGIYVNSSSAVNEMIGKPSIMTGVLNNPITINSSDSLKLTYTDSIGTSYYQILNLDPGSYNSTLASKEALADMIQNKISPPLDNKVSVSIDGSGNLKLESKDLGPYASVNIVKNYIDPSHDASTAIFASKSIQNGSLNESIKLGVTRNDQLKITFSDKTTAASTQFDKDTGFTISDPQWTLNTFTIQIPHSTYTSGNDFSNAINSVILGTPYSNKVNVSFSNVYGDIGKVQFTTANQGSAATLQLQDVNSAKGSNMFSILSLSSYTAYGEDKTDTFAIEVNAQYTEKELDDNDLSADDIQKLLDNKIIYTPNGYIIQDPLNPCDFIEYTKIQGTGEIQQITLATHDYASKDEFASALESAISNSSNQLGNDVKVTVDNSTGGFNISTTQQDGAKSSVRFVTPPNPSVPGNQSPINTSMDELLNNFLNVTGFDYNRHVGKNGTGKMNIQVGANSNQDVLVKIGSVRAGALEVKYLDVTTSQKASEAISIIDNAINKVSSERTNLGAFQNAFEHVVSNLENTSTNLTSAQSGIEDADMSKEIMMMSKNNILQQAAQAMLAQANQEPQKVLQLLKQS